MTIMEQNKKVLSGFYDLDFLWILIWGVTWLSMRACAKFVYLFKISQCIFSYDSSSLGTGNINELWFHLVQEYLQKLSIRFL